jgi:hypothetical protein
MSDEVFLRAFTDCSLSPGAFHHRDHLRLAWLLTRRHGVESACSSVADGIRAFAARHGHAEKYHETMTQFWVRLVGHLIDARPDIGDFTTFVETFPQLLDASLPYRHWRRQTIGSAAARSAWVAPDLLALPW